LAEGDTLGTLDQCLNLLAVVQEFLCLVLHLFHAHLPLAILQRCLAVPKVVYVLMEVLAHVIDLRDALARPACSAFRIALVGNHEVVCSRCTGDEVVDSFVTV
jgi:hypothetical protein